MRDILGVVPGTVSVTESPSWMKWKINLGNSLGTWPTVTGPLLSTLFIVILQQYGSMPMEILLTLFSITTCYVSVCFSNLFRGKRGTLCYQPPQRMNALWLTWKMPKRCVYTSSTHTHTHTHTIFYEFFVIWFARTLRRR